MRELFNSDPAVLTRMNLFLEQPTLYGDPPAHVFELASGETSPLVSH